MVPTEAPLRRALIALTALLGLTACSNSFFGAAEKAPLKGKRISILVHQRSLQPDPGSNRAEILLPAPTPNAEWPQTGGYANHAMHHIKVPKAIGRAWRTSIGEGSDDDRRLIAQPIMAQGRIFTMDSETRVSAFDSRSGGEIWSVELVPEEEEDDSHIGGGLAFERGRVYVTTGFAQVMALDAGTGKVIWRRDLGAPMRAAPTARGNRVFVLTVTNKLHALHGATGKTLWTHSGIEETTNLLGGASPAVDGGVVVTAYSSGEIAALKVENGLELWSDSLSSPRRINVGTRLSAIRGRPIIDRGMVIAISSGGLMAAINLRTGRRIWEKEVSGFESPWVAGQFIFVLTHQSELVALARATGRILWVRALPQWEDEEDREGRIVWTGPILASDRLIVASSNGIAYSISPYTGRILGAEELPDGVKVGPIVAGNSVYILSEDAELFAYR